MHKRDADQAANAAFSAIALLVVDESRDINDTVSGWLGWEGDASSPDCKITSATINASAYLISKETP